MIRSQIFKKSSILKQNTKNIRTVLQDGAMLMCVVKGNAYGHGINKTVEIINDLTDWYGVATFDEAIEVRSISNRNILILGAVSKEHLSDVVKYGFTLNGFSKEYITDISKWAKKNNQNVNLHLEIDTGFNRTGMKIKEEFFDKDYEIIKNLYMFENINITGIFTHFLYGNNTDEYEMNKTLDQFNLFSRVFTKLEAEGLDVGIKHCCNSKATLNFPDLHLDMVRVGAYLFGLLSHENQKEFNLHPVLSWYSSIIQEKEIYLDEGISYSEAYKAEYKHKIAVVQTGFADGYPRTISEKENNFVLVDGIKAKIIGKICMDFLIINAEELNGDLRGKKVTLIGSEEESYLSAYYLGRLVGSTAGEITCCITNRVVSNWI